MSLRDRIEAEKPAPRRTQLDVWLDGLDTEDRDALYAIAADPAWSVSRILRVVKAEGCAVGKEKLTEWVDSVRTS